MDWTEAMSPSVHHRFLDGFDVSGRENSCEDASYEAIPRVLACKHLVGNSMKKGPSDPLAELIYVIRDELKKLIDGVLGYFLDPEVQPAPGMPTIDLLV